MLRVARRYSTPSISGSIPVISPNIVHNLETRERIQSLTKRVKKKKKIASQVVLQCKSNYLKNK